MIPSTISYNQLESAKYFNLNIVTVENQIHTFYFFTERILL